MANLIAIVVPQNLGSMANLIAIVPQNLTSLGLSSNMLLLILMLRLYLIPLLMLKIILKETTSPCL